MALRATHVSSGIEIDLEDQDNLVTQGLLNELHHRCRRGVLECREHDGNGVVHGIWVYLQRRRGQWLLCHHDGSHVHRAATGKSVQHQWQQDYWQRAGDAAGYETCQEASYAGVRVDVAIVGPATTVGVEVQRSSLAVASAIGRTQKARKCGVTSLWSADYRRPSWAYRVPHVETNLLPEGYAPRGSWTVVDGPRKLIPTKCVQPNFAKCPDTGRSRLCERHHPRFGPLIGDEHLCVDDVAERAPAGDLVPLEVRGRQRWVYLVSAADKALYAELVADSGGRADTGDRSRGRPFGPCRHDVVDRDIVADQEPRLAPRRDRHEDLPYDVWLMLARGYDR